MKSEYESNKKKMVEILNEKEKDSGKMAGENKEILEGYKKEIVEYVGKVKEQ